LFIWSAVWYQSVRIKRCCICHNLFGADIQDNICLSLSYERRKVFISFFVQKMLIEGDCRIEWIEVLKIFSFQLQVMSIDYTACGFCH
jgi:hypothetical protein